MAIDAIVRATDLRSYFHGAVQSAVDNQRVPADDETIWYLSNLLTDYSRSERFFDQTSEGRRLLPLAELYSRAVYADSTGKREYWLRRLGDVALFVAGMFADVLERRPVGLDYYISMGGAAYSSLIEGNGAGGRCVFATLSRRFVAFVDVLSEIGEARGPAGANDPLRLYERWRQTGSPRLARQLREMGVVPVSRTRLQ